LGKNKLTEEEGVENRISFPLGKNQQKGRIVAGGGGKNMRTEARKGGTATPGGEYLHFGGNYGRGKKKEIDSERRKKESAKKKAPDKKKNFILLQREVTRTGKRGGIYRSFSKILPENCLPGFEREKKAPTGGGEKKRPAQLPRGE